MFFKKSIFCALLYCLFSQSVVTAMEHIFNYARGQDIEGVKRCLERGISVNAQNHNKSTVLHCALSWKNTQKIPVDDKLVALLLEQKADANAQDASLETPMHCAASHNRVRALALLKEAHGDLNALNHIGSTPCHAAVMGNNFEMIIWFGNAGADMNLFDHRGQTPLHAAVYYEKPSAVDLLLRHRAKLAATTRTNSIKDAPQSTIVPAGSTIFHLAAMASVNGLVIKRILLYHGLLHPQGTPLLPKALVTFWWCIKQAHPEKVSILKPVLMPYLMQSLSPKTIVHFLGSPKDHMHTATLSMLQQRLDVVKALVAAEDENGNTAFRIEYPTIPFKPSYSNVSLIAELCYDRHLKEFAQAAQNNTITQLPPDNVLKVAYDVALEIEA